MSYLRPARPRAFAFLAARARAKTFFITRRSAADSFIRAIFYRKDNSQILANVIHRVETCTKAVCSFTKVSTKSFLLKKFSSNGAWIVPGAG